MAPVRNARVILGEMPDPMSYPDPDKSVLYDPTPTIDIDTIPLNGGFLVKSLVFSIDPYLRGTMRPGGYVVGQPIYGFGLGVVIRSESPEVKPGDHVEGGLTFEEYSIRSTLRGSNPVMNLTLIENKENIPWTAYVGVAGMPGRTAFYGWKEYSKAKKGEVIFVSTGAGPVGSLVIQLAKREGLKVIACAGSDEKVQLIKDFGADVAFNYKTTKTRDVLAKEGPIDMYDDSRTFFPIAINSLLRLCSRYWDHVGGEMLDDALVATKEYARIIACGMISGYNSGNATPVRNLSQIMYKNVSLFGFYVFNLDRKYKEEFYRTIPALVAKGEIKYKEDVVYGLEKTGHAILAQQKGQNIGKSILIVSQE
ncbi:hypothetical protein VNI00_006393 [Paramarasmius palmivorus]|uniref:Enoyl reductase (ER) domain-containing protein n=1 Tax=Paramarasmius palmivorus TaxID=297713 RepID=A0AAW0D5A7_9AGAR